MLRDVEVDTKLKITCNVIDKTVDILLVRRWAGVSLYS